jgi:hypothetical protein
MRRKGLLFLIIPAILLLSTCAEFDPQWAGIWVDNTTVPNVVITLDFSKWEGTLTVDNSDPPENGVQLTVVQGDLDGDENTLLAEITSIYQKYNDSEETEVTITHPVTIYVFVITPPDPVDCPGCLGIEWPCSASYKIQGDTITLTGDLIVALTDGVSDTLTATKQTP